MKTRENRYIEQETINSHGGGCCGSTPVQAKAVENSCCEQPTDGSSCCDKDESKEVNREMVGCC